MTAPESLALAVKRRGHATQLLDAYLEQEHVSPVIPTEPTALHTWLLGLIDFTQTHVQVRRFDSLGRPK